MEYAKPLAKLVGEFEKLPGIGPKSAQRLAFHVLRMTEENAQAFAAANAWAFSSVMRSTWNASL